MKTSDHAKHTEKLFGIRADDIHHWIDAFFDHENYEYFVWTGATETDPYAHRQFRHCIEALDEAYEEFKGKYSKAVVKKIFKTHLMDDYDGYIPSRSDFADDRFNVQYHYNNEIENDQSILTCREQSNYFKSHSMGKTEKQEKKSSTDFYLGILLPTIVAIILFIASIFTIIIPVFQKNMMDQKKEMIKELTASAASIIEHYILKEESGAMIRQNAQKEAINAIKEMRYGSDNKNYFWITDMYPVMVMHPYSTDLIGKDLRNYKDSSDKSGIRLFVEFVELVKQHNEGYLEYQWQLTDDPSKTASKLSYIRGIPKWNYIIGTGVYINDVEEEIKALQTDLLISFSIISGVLLLILVYIVFQSRKIDSGRRQAEAGLKEAKDRYQALVESSGEGYLLEVEGEVIYSNHTLQKMLEYSEKEFTAPDILDRLFTDLNINENIITHLELLFKNKARPGQFEAQIHTKTQKILHVVITTSKIFFSKKNGHIVSFRPIVGKKLITSSNGDKSADAYLEVASSITDQIKNSENMSNIVKALNKMPLLVRDMLDEGTNADHLRRMIGTAYDAAIAHFIKFSIDELGPPPTVFSFISLGSNARHEMTMFSDQDSAIIFSDVEKSQLHDFRRYFLTLANQVCKKLDQAGYPYCSGDFMAVNPKWCLTFSEWKHNFKSWITNATPESILDINVFFDIHNAYGDQELFDQLNSFIREQTKKNPLFFQHYARNCLLYRPPLNLFGKIQTTDNLVSLKKCLQPIELFARLYALKYDVRATNTIERLNALAKENIITEDSCREIIYIFDYIWHLRFKNQVHQYGDLRKVNNKLNLDHLIEIERDNLKNILHKIRSFQTMLSYDFFGTPNASP
jgi:CBS domain-containing protein